LNSLSVWANRKSGKRELFVPALFKKFLMQENFAYIWTKIITLKNSLKEFMLKRIFNREYNYVFKQDFFLDTIQLLTFNTF
jgi:hypothetical protein